MGSLKSKVDLSDLALSRRPAPRAAGFRKTKQQKMERALEARAAPLDARVPRVDVRGQRVDEMEHANSGQLAAVHGQRFPMGQGWRCRPCRCRLVRFEYDGRSQQPVWAKLGRLHGPSGLSYGHHWFGHRRGSESNAGEGHAASDALQRYLPRGIRLHPAAGQPQPGRLLRSHDRPHGRSGGRL